MGLQSCKPCNSCPQSKEECRPAGRCSYEHGDWRYCPDRCCDICCQMCVDVCSGLCSGDCSYTFCYLFLGLAENCISLLTPQKAETQGAQSRKVCLPGLLSDEEEDQKHKDFDSECKRRDFLRAAERGFNSGPPPLQMAEAYRG